MIVLRIDSPSLVPIINHLDSNNFVFYSTKNKTNSLKYFYELSPNIIVKDTLPWLKNITQQTINTDALNESTEYEIKKKDGVFRIITLGDSFTYSPFINTRDNWTELLERKLNDSCKNMKKYEVINLGVSGYDIEYSVQRYMIRGKKYNPDMILYFLKNDDIDIVSEEANDYMHTHLKSGDPISKEIIIQSQEYMKKRIPRPQAIDREINALHKMGEIYSGKIIFFNMFSFDRDIFERLSSFVRQNENLTMITKSQIESPYSNMASSKYSYAPWDYHPNPEGHKEIANSIFNYFLTHNLISCK